MRIVAMGRCEVIPDLPLTSPRSGVPPRAPTFHPMCPFNTYVYVHASTLASAIHAMLVHEGGPDVSGWTPPPRKGHPNQHQR